MSEIPKVSECCGKPIWMSLGDGVVMGSCSGCYKPVCRLNPKTRRAEWLDGESPWTHKRRLRPMVPQ